MLQNNKNLSFDLNCDLGEGMANDAEIMPFLSSCNIACGGHAGNLASMREVVALAALHDVKIGAHPSYPDKVNFGRKPMEISNKELLDSLVAQVQSLQSVVHSYGSKLHHIKPHGALYNIACVDVIQAAVVVRLIQIIDKNLILYAPYKSVLANLALENDIQVMYEAFADRNYSDDRTLLSRQKKKAIITDPEKAMLHVVTMLKEGYVETLMTKKIPIKVNTVCIHSDTKGAEKFVAEFHAKILAQGISIQ